MTETTTTRTSVERKAQPILKMTGEWTKGSTYYKVTVNKSKLWSKLSSFYVCDGDPARVVIRGANGNMTHTTRPLLKNYFISRNSLSNEIQSLFNECETQILHFADRVAADTFKNEARRIIEWMINDNNRTAGDLNFTISAQKEE